MRTAWLAANVINVWLEKGKSVTPRKLLGEEFFKESRSTSTLSPKEWEDHKQELKKMSDKHSQILKDIKSGKRKTKNVIQFVGAKERGK